MPNRCMPLFRTLRRYEVRCFSKIAKWIEGAAKVYTPGMICQWLAFGKVGRHPFDSCLFLMKVVRRRGCHLEGKRTDSFCFYRKNVVLVLQFAADQQERMVN